MGINYCYNMETYTHNQHIMILFKIQYVCLAVSDLKFGQN